MCEHIPFLFSKLAKTKTKIHKILTESLLRSTEYCLELKKVGKEKVMKASTQIMHNIGIIYPIISTSCSRKFPNYTQLVSYSKFSVCKLFELDYDQTENCFFF